MIISHQRFLIGVALFICGHTYAMDLPEWNPDDKRDIEACLHEVESGASPEQKPDEIITPEQFVDEIIAQSGIKSFKSRDELVRNTKKMPLSQLRQLSHFVRVEASKDHQNAWRTKKLLLLMLDASVQIEKGARNNAEQEQSISFQRQIRLFLGSAAAVCLVLASTMRVS